MWGVLAHRLTEIGDRARAVMRVAEQTDVAPVEGAPVADRVYDTGPFGDVTTTIPHFGEDERTLALTGLGGPGEPSPAKRRQLDRPAAQAA